MKTRASSWNWRRVGAFAAGVGVVAVATVATLMFTRGDPVWVPRRPSASPSFTEKPVQGPRESAQGVPPEVISAANDKAAALRSRWLVWAARNKPLIDRLASAAPGDT